MHEPSYVTHARPEFPYGRATAVYVVALALIAAAVTSGYALVSGLNQRIADDATLVNVAGRQRMLAQRIARVALALRTSPSPEGREAQTRELREDYERWRRGHGAIVGGNGPLGAFAPGTERRTSLDAAFLAVEVTTKMILAYADGGEAGQSELPRLGALGAFCDEYSGEIDDFVLSLERESEAQVHEIGIVLKVVVVGSLLLVGAEGLMVFRPLIRGLRSSYRELDDAHRELQRELEMRLVAERERDELKGLLPICSGCKKIRDDGGDWKPLEQYIEARSEARFSHGLCKDCLIRLYPEHADAVLAKAAARARRGL